jgi:hypothetical protein
MTAFMVVEAYVTDRRGEKQKHMSVLAYRTGLFTSSFWLARKKLSQPPQERSGPAQKARAERRRRKAFRISSRWQRS